MPDPAVSTVKDGSAPAADVREGLAELRLRTAMELHDGILQTLTAASLRIAAARQMLESDPGGAGEVLDQVVESIIAEQREIRLYVDEIRDESFPPFDGPALADRLETLVHRAGLVWGARASVQCSGAERVPQEMVRQILRIGQEATVNAARHGGAREITVAVEPVGSEVVITVRDDGHGFPFIGEYDHEALRSQRLGPLSLKQRVAAADGRIAIRSTEDGATVTVHLPIPGVVAE